MSSFVALPYTRVAGWSLHQLDTSLNYLPERGSVPSLVDHSIRDSETEADEEARTPLDLFVQTIDTVVDVYNAHHHCCWPRLMLDSRVAESAQRVGASGEQASAVEAAERAEAVALASYVTRLHALLQERTQRTAFTRRVVYRNELPPVLRCVSDKSVVYTIEGTFVLRERESAACTKREDGQHPPRREGCYCSGSEARAMQRRRRRFPLFLTVAASESCAAYLRSHSRTTAASSTALIAGDSTVCATPQLLVLQDIHPAPCATPSSEASPAEDASLLLEAVYSSFSFVFSPSGNALRPGGGKPHQTQSGDASVPTSSAGSHLCGDGGDTASVAAPLDPLRVEFDVYVDRYPSQEAREATVGLVTSLLDYSPTTSFATRFGLRSTHGTSVLPPNAEGSKHVVEHNPLLLKRKKVTLSRRPALLMKALDHQPEVPKRQRAVSRAPRVAVAASATTSNPSEDAMIAPRRWYVDPRAHASLVKVATLRTTLPLCRERCPFPNASHLGSLLPESTPWPLSLQRNERSIKSKAGCGDEQARSPLLLLPEQHLDDLAAALRQI